MSCLVMSCHVMSCHVMSCHVMSCLVMSCHVMSCHVMSCYVLLCHVLLCHVMLCHVMSCHEMLWRIVLYQLLALNNEISPSKPFEKNFMRHHLSINDCSACITYEHLSTLPLLTSFFIHSYILPPSQFPPPPSAGHDCLTRE